MQNGVRLSARSQSRPRLHSFESPFTIGDFVAIDGDASIRMRVTGLCFRAGLAEVEVSYVNNGVIETQWVAAWRLTPLA